jgi:hypothetical protein
MGKGDFFPRVWKEVWPYWQLASNPMTEYLSVVLSYYFYDSLL